VAELKTKRTTESVSTFLAGIADPQRRAEARTVVALMQKATGIAPAMWGPSIVGFGKMTYEGAGGRAVDWFPVGFAPRKAAITIYLMSGLSQHAVRLKKLGPHSTGKGCLYLPKFAEVDLKVLARMVSDAMPKTTATVVKARRQARS
jgi:hypothetical protein